MTEEEKQQAASALDLHEEFIQHVEKGSSIIRVLSLVTIAVASILFVSYAYQLLVPYISGTTSVTVNLLDPALQATELIVAILTLLWLYLGVRDYLFTRRMARSIREARLLEREIEKRIVG